MILICVPTPLDSHREPDMRYVEGSAWQVGARVRPGQLVILESTTYPGTIDELLPPIISGTRPDRRQTGGDGAWEDESSSSQPDRVGAGRGSLDQTTRAA